MTEGLPSKVAEWGALGCTLFAQTNWQSDISTGVAVLAGLYYATKLVKEWFYDVTTE